ncbi:conserved protein of unknown function [Petrocella atlantisensis]|uniref:Magnesium transporter MgtE intracellular domain-containing protein n=1 Tax=Petrocella atlantisensis TaxID=2173034 RepID=A0A3P7RTX7_9FIRM|nr:hypothetical protein [Petrocella atlantisensis]VDN46322.1 conserved protein of unknown function [Petrocella atlantisensis]
MARDNSEDRENNIMKIVGGILVGLLVLAIALAALIKFDVGGLGTTVIGPVIKDVPVLNMILPKMPEVSEEDVEAYNFETVEEAVEILKITEKMLMEKSEEAENIGEQLSDLTAEVERLRIFEANQVQFQEDKAQFDELLATTPAAIVYTEWFEKMYPENAVALYESMIGEVVFDETLKETVDIYQNMKPAQAAPVLESMSITQMDQVAAIIKGVSPDQAAKIMGLMEPRTAARITSYIYP